MTKVYIRGKKDSSLSYLVQSPYQPIVKGLPLNPNSLDPDQSGSNLFVFGNQQVTKLDINTKKNIPGTKSLSTSVMSPIVSGLPHNCFQTGSARLILRGLPVLIAIPIRIPVTSDDNLKLFLYQCRLLMAFANSLDPDQARHTVKPDRNSNCLTH